MAIVAPRAASQPRALGDLTWCMGEAITYHFTSIPRGACPLLRHECGYSSLFSAPSSSRRSGNAASPEFNAPPHRPNGVTYGLPEDATDLPPKIWESAATQRGFAPKTGLPQLSRQNFGTRQISGCPRPTIWPHDFMFLGRFGTAVEAAYDLRLGRATRRRNQREKLGIHEISRLVIFCVSTD